jgi:glycosyltransferase involved in cell wall biosynthesis
VQAASDTNGGVYFFGPIDNRDVPSYYRASDIFVHPHLRTTNGRDTSEGYGCVLIEAASMSLPIVASDRVGAAEDVVCDSVNGFIVDSASLLEDLYHKLAWLVSNPDKLKDFGRESRVRYEELYSVARNALTLEKLLAETNRILA